MLDNIVASKKREIALAQEALPFDELKSRVGNYQPAYSLSETLATTERISLIAELKRKSPSKGLLREDFNPVELAPKLQRAGADALSILTDEPFFGGSIDYLKNIVACTEIPRLRKDFILEPYQVYQSAYYGADAVLLIVRLLDDAQLRLCLETTQALNMDALVEIHSAEEVGRALSCGARIIGINHRDLDTFVVDTSLSARLMADMPSGKVIVAESGIHTPEDVARMQALGVHGLLIGESIMTESNVEEKILSMFSMAWKDRVLPGGEE